MRKIIPILKKINSVDKLKSLYNKYLIHEVDTPLEFIGENWENDNVTDIAIFIGFNPWKREFISDYLNIYKTAFLVGKVNPEKIYRLQASFLTYHKNDRITFFVWGKKDSVAFHNFIKYKNLIESSNIKIQYVEDGFIRSIGAGILHSKPYSLNFDSKGNHFENKMTDLENLLSTYKLTEDEKKLSEAYLNLFRDIRLTKYYNTAPFDYSKQLINNSNFGQGILVLGQIEDDASILYGDGEIKTNLDLIKLAKKENPNAKIYYRPHPDYLSGIRKEGGSEQIKKICDILTSEVSIFESFLMVQKVYVISSLSGFEALIHGKEVITVGTPFYSNWGLTDDRVQIDRRDRKLNLNELFYIAYCIYPKYIYPTSNSQSTFIEIISYILVEALKGKDYFALDENMLFTNAIAYSDILDIPFKVLAYIKNTEDFAKADTEEFFKIINQNFDIKYYPQISKILIRSANYELLAKYTNFCLHSLCEDLDSNNVNYYILESFYSALYAVQKKLHGRKIEEIPSLILYFNENGLYKHKNFQRLFKLYLSTLSSNLQYKQLDEVVNWLENLQEFSEGFITKVKSFSNEIDKKNNFLINSGHYSIFIDVLHEKTSKRERDALYRNQLLTKVSDLYLKSINKEYKSAYDELVNNALYFTKIYNYKQASKELLSFMASLNQDMDKVKLTVLNTRTSHLIQIGNFLLTYYYLEEVEKLIALLSRANCVNREDKRHISYMYLLIHFHLRSKNFDKLIETYENLSKDTKSAPKIRSIMASHYFQQGIFDKSIELTLSNAKSTIDDTNRDNLLYNVDKMKFSQQTTNIINSVNQPIAPKGVVFMASHNCYNTLAMMTPAIVELKKKGFAFVYLSSGMIKNQPTGVEMYDKFIDIIGKETPTKGFYYDWSIDWENRIVEAEGINFYQGFYERVSNQTRRYFIDLNADPFLKKSFMDNLRYCDQFLYTIDKIFHDVTKRGIRTIVIGSNSHVTPYSIIRDYCMHKNHPLLSYISCNVAYESYFSNLGSKFANTMCVTDMTLYPTIRAPFLARQDQFDTWYAANQNNPNYIEQANNLLSLNRVMSSTNDKEIEILEKLKEYKTQGKKIICAFGKVPVDLSVPYDGGPAHRGMSDWITNTVEICNELEDEVILLVKPHPHELRPEIALDLVEGFHDLIKCQINKNVILLGHQDINGKALAPMLDLALLYNGSSGVELTAQGIPVMMASYFGKHDYPITMLYPEGREQYRDFIRSLNYPSPAQETRKRAAFLLCYLGTDEISILNQYSKRPLTNDSIGIPTWRHKKIEKFLKEGY